MALTKQTLNLRCEIDLNYLDLLPTTVETFGWVIDQPLVILIDVEENRLLNSLERHEFKTAGFNVLHQRGILKFSCVNNGSNKSFGC